MGEFYNDRIEGYICDECLKERAEFFNFVRNDGKVITFNKVLEDSRKTRRGFVRDIAKKLLNVGDEVAFIVPGCLYLRVGKIVDFTPKMAKIEYEWGGYTNIINRPSSQIAKI